MGRGQHETLHFEGQEFLIFRRAFRRTMTVSIHTTGQARIVTSKLMPVQLIRAFIKDNAEWISRKQSEFEELRNRHPPKRFEEGEEFLLLGEPRELILLPAKSARLRVSGHADNLVLWYPEKAERPAPKDIRGAVLRFYEAEGRKLLKDRVQFWSGVMGLSPKSLSFRSQKSRWGSCSARGRISLNWKLIASPLEVLDYVVVHELSHLVHGNHSEQFWSYVSRFVDGLDRKKQWLKDHHYDLDFLSKTSDLHVHEPSRIASK